MSQVTGKYLLAFHACTPDSGVNCGSTSNHLSYLAQGNDGANWSVVQGWAPWSGGVGTSGSVPDVVRRGNMLYIYNPGALHRYNLATGALSTALSVSISGADAGYVDPSPLLFDGGIVLFFLPGVIGQDPASCGADASSCQRAIRSASEVQGSDGVSFVQDQGDRVSVTLTSPKTFSDPDIFADPTGFVLYVSQGADVLAYHSDGGDLRGTYTPVAGLPGGNFPALVAGGGGVPAGHYDFDAGVYWTFVNTNIGGINVIRRAVHPTLNVQVDSGAFSMVVYGTTVGLPASTNIESPGFAVNTP